ncbi:ABC transporter permease [Nocardiopsis gilva]|nr:ABC transporter permease [Nocardiopsis gilva]
MDVDIPGLGFRGILAMLGLFGTAFAGFGLLPELRNGSHERLLATPTSRVALLLGRVMRDVVVLLIQAVVLLVGVTAFGFRASALGVLVGLLLLAVLGVGLGTFSYLLAMVLKVEHMFAALLQTVIMPLILTSGLLLPMEQGPTWLYIVSRFNPVTHVVEAERALFAGHFTDPSIAIGSAVAVAVAVLALSLGVGSMRRINA